MIDKPSIFTFLPDIAATTRTAILDQYAQFHPALRRGFESFNGTNVAITIAPDSYSLDGDRNGFSKSARFGGIQISAISLSAANIYVPIEQRTLRNYGKSNVTVVERNLGLGDRSHWLSTVANKLSDLFGGNISEADLRHTTVHELGHHIDAALINNYANGPQAAHAQKLGLDRLTKDQQFIAAYQKDLREAGIVNADGRLTPNNGKTPHLWSYILPKPDKDGAISLQEWQRATTEGFAEVFAHRYSKVNEERKKRSPEEVSDFSIFKNFTPLVAAAVNHFAGEDVPPVNKIPGEGPPPVSASLYAPGSLVDNDTPHTAEPPEKFAEFLRNNRKDERDRRDLKGAICASPQEQQLSPPTGGGNNPAGCQQNAPLRLQQPAQ